VTLDQLHLHWKQLSLFNGIQAKPLKSFLKECQGERRGGLLFYTYQGDITILKSDEHNSLYKLVGEDDGEDWVYLGELEFSPFI